MGIFTGLNGFIISTSRLLFAMSRAKFIPKSFSKVHPKYNTPYVSVIFTVAVSMIAPWFGREALTWGVDMSSIGVTIAYFYTCYTAFTLFSWNQSGVLTNKKIENATVKKTFGLLGMIAGLCFLGLLLVPGSPAVLGFESRIALLAWILLGILFYFVKRKEIHAIPEKELEYLILGKEDKK